MFLKKIFGTFKKPMLNKKTYLVHLPQWSVSQPPMGLLPDSEVYENPKNFGIITNEYGGWHSDEITPDVLNARVADFRNFCSELSVKVSG